MRQIQALQALQILIASLVLQVAPLPCNQCVPSVVFAFRPIDVTVFIALPGGVDKWLIHHALLDLYYFNNLLIIGFIIHYFYIL